MKNPGKAPPIKKVEVTLEQAEELFNQIYHGTEKLTNEEKGEILFMAKKVLEEQAELLIQPASIIGRGGQSRVPGLDLTWSDEVREFSKKFEVASKNTESEEAKQLFTNIYYSDSDLDIMYDESQKRYYEDGKKEGLGKTARNQILYFAKIFLDNLGELLVNNSNLLSADGRSRVPGLDFVSLDSVSLDSVTKYEKLFLKASEVMSGNKRSIFS